MSEPEPPIRAVKATTYERVVRWIVWAVFGAVTVGALVWTLVIDRL